MSTTIRLHFDAKEFLSAFIARALLLLLTAYIVMLLLGAAHFHDSVVPNLSYWGSFFVSLAIQVVMDLRLGDDDD